MLIKITGCLFKTNIKSWKKSHGNKFLNLPSSHKSAPSFSILYDFTNDVNFDFLVSRYLLLFTLR